MFVNFALIERSHDLEKEFLSQATELNLSHLIKENKQIRCVFHKNADYNIYLVMIVCSNDNLMIKLGQQYNFPRGFPVIWIPNIKIQTFGFYPKFDNDQRQEADDLKEFCIYAHVNEIHFFKKWSGFLGQCLAFTYNEMIMWTVCSKNSASSESLFVQDAKRLFEPFITNDLLKEMINENIHFCAEIMSKNDQTHGTRVKKEMPIITCIGRGSLCSINESEKNIIKPNFVDFFNHTSLVDFCVKHNIPCDSAITITQEAQKFLQSLSQERDFMDDHKLQDLMNTCENLIVQKGTVSHSDILGQCLEGLVIKLVHSDGSTSVKKYKFPGYTIRTMLLRETFKNFSFNSNLKNKAREFVESWCVTPVGKNYWYNFALEAFVKFMNFQPSENDIGTHILISETLLSNGITGYDFDLMLSSMIKGTVVICIGPIGSGKTTIAKKLCKEIGNDLAVEIDGDDLGIGSYALKCGHERNDFSRFKIIEALLGGKVPIISTGGGILFVKDELILRKQIYDTLGINIKIMVLMAGMVSEVVAWDKQADLSTIYENTNLVKNAVLKRVNMGMWTVDPKFKTGKTSDKQAAENFAKFIIAKSNGNIKFAMNIIDDADEVFVFPCLTEENYGIQDKFDYTKVKNKIVFAEPKIGKFEQIRFLTFIDDKPGHITVQYNKNKDILMSLVDFINLSNFYDKDIDGDIITMEGSENEIIFAVPNLKVHKDGSTHITMNSGIHMAKDMKLAALAYLVNNSVTLLKDGVPITYTIKSKKSCIIKIMGIFGI